MKIWSWSALLEACQKVIAVKNGPQCWYKPSTILYSIYKCMDAILESEDLSKKTFAHAFLHANEPFFTYSCINTISADENACPPQKPG